MRLSEIGLEFFLVDFPRLGHHPLLHTPGRLDRGSTMEPHGPGRHALGSRRQGETLQREGGTGGGQSGWEVVGLQVA